MLIHHSHFAGSARIDACCDWQRTRDVDMQHAFRLTSKVTEWMIYAQVVGAAMRVQPLTCNTLEECGPWSSGRRRGAILAILVFIRRWPSITRIHNTLFASSGLYMQALRRGESCATIKGPTLPQSS